MRQSVFYREIKTKLKGHMTEDAFENLIFSELEVYNLGRGDVLIKENRPPKVYTLVLEGKVLEMKHKQGN